MPKPKKKTAKKSKKLHVKPTEKALAESIKKTVEEAEALKAESETPSEPVPTPSELVPSPEAPQEPTPSKAIIKDVLKREKKKSIASSQEALILHAKNKKTNEALLKAREVPEPTEEEMKAEYPDWEAMSDFEQKMAKQTLLANKRFAVLDEVAEEFKDSEKHKEKIDGFLDDPKTLVDYPELEGREDEFKLFTAKPTRRGIEFKDLVSAFLYNASAEKSKQKKKKGKMFPDGVAGPSEPGKKAGKISIEDAILLKKTDFKKYKSMLMSGKIDTGDL